jgi:hypothetical protein
VLQKVYLIGNYKLESRLDLNKMSNLEIRIYSYNFKLVKVYKSNLVYLDFPLFINFSTYDFSGICNIL